MNTQISEWVGQYEKGQMSRRDLIGRLSALAAAMTVAGQTEAAPESKSTFEALELNHIALRVTDVNRSRDFYKKHLGLTVRRESPGRNCFMTCGNHFVALFRSDTPRMDHYCYSIKDYDQQSAAKKLRGQGLEPETPQGSNRIYFKDPDGLKVQLAAINHRP